MAKSKLIYIVSLLVDERGIKNLNQAERDQGTNFFMHDNT
jgi:hypothetical protein